MKRKLAEETWQLSFTSAAAACKRSTEDLGFPNDGGGANGTISVKDPRRGHDIVAFLPHHRDPAEDEDREHVGRAIASVPKLIAALKAIAELADQPLKRTDYPVGGAPRKGGRRFAYRHEEMGAIARCALREIFHHKPT